MNCSFSVVGFTLSGSCSDLICVDCKVEFNLVNTETNLSLYNETRNSNNLTLNYVFNSNTCGNYHLNAIINNSSGLSSDVIRLEEYQSNFFVTILFINVLNKCFFLL